MGNCTVKLKIVDAGGTDAANIPVSVRQVMVNGVPDSGFIADYMTDSEGIASLPVPQGAGVLLACPSCAGLNNLRFVVPNVSDYFLGVYSVDAAGVNNPYVPGLRVYRALLTQLNMDDPTAVVFENSLGGDIVWTRSNVGSYVGTLTGAFPQHKTFLRIANPVTVGPAFAGAYIVRSNDNQVSITTVDTSTGDGYDGELEDSPVEILVYPT